MIQTFAAQGVPGHGGERLSGQPFNDLINMLNKIQIK